jgi:hypothetical protein
LLKILYLFLQKWIERKKFMEIDVRVRIGKRRRLGVTNTVAKSFVTLLMFFEKIPIYAFSFISCWFHFRRKRGLRLIHWWLVKIITVVDFYCQFSLMRYDGPVILLFWLLVKLLELDKLSFREADAVAWSWWSYWAAVEF